MTDPESKTFTEEEKAEGQRQSESASPEHFDFEDLTGREVAHCRVKKKLGQGAMGAVYLAEQLSLRRTVALKVLDPKFSRDLTYIERFEREAQAAARLGHFNIVQVFDFGREDDIYYIMSEYVDGGNVQDIIERDGILEPNRAIDIVLQACRGLATAQEQDIVHRDIKPENLMLTKALAVKIADFGLAKVVSDNATVTQSGMIVGTPFYMSPEQAKGLALDGRSDIYSLGVTFFHMLTGQIPFDADSVIGVLLKQISAERPDPVAINPSIPHALGPIVLKMMARLPEERYQTAADLIPTLQQLQSDLHGSQVEIPPAVEGVSEERRARYKLLPRSQIIRMAPRDANPAVIDKMKAHLKGDTGVFIQCDESYPENSVLELQFTVPGQDKLYVALGLVRWSHHESSDPGLGVSFLKVNSVPASAAQRTSSRRATAAPAPGGKEEEPEELARDLQPKEIVALLTRSQTHARLLRYYYANTGQMLPIGNVASALGVGMRMMDEPLRDFERYGLVQRREGGILAFVWAEDNPQLQEEIVGWIRKYGLL